MKQCTPFGKTMRVLRTNHNETMKDIADMLGVTVAYLSAVEHGKRNIPNRWIELLVNHYPDEHTQLLESMDMSKTHVTFNIQNIEPFKREMILAFERSFQNLSESTAKSIIQCLEVG